MTFRDQFAKLIDVKTIITLAMVGTLIYGFIARFVSLEVFAPVLTAVIAYFFNKDKKPDPLPTTVSTETTTTSTESTIPTEVKDA